jgi:hypothetical protein
MRTRLLIGLAGAIAALCAPVECFAWCDHPHIDVSIYGAYCCFDPGNLKYYVGYKEQITIDASGSCDPDEHCCTSPHYQKCKECGSDLCTGKDDLTKGIRRFYYNANGGFWSETCSSSDFDGVTTTTFHYVGDSHVRVEVFDRDASCCCEEEDPPPPGCGSKWEDMTKDIVVVRADLVMNGLGEEAEEDPGAYVGLNNDDDNENCAIDSSETATVTGEDDLVAISLSVSPAQNEGQVRLIRSSEKIKVWDSPTKGTGHLVIPDGENDYKIWDISSYPSTLYVEGVSRSLSLGDVELWLSYIRNSCTVHRDKVKITVVEVDLDMSGVSDSEETCKGGYIGINDDDDDNSCWEDRGEDGTVSGENDLVAITLHRVGPTGVTGTVELKALAGGTNVRVWTDPTKGTQVGLPKTYSTPAELPKTLYVEGFSSSGLRSVTLALEYTGGGLTCDDRVKATVVKVDLYVYNIKDRNETCKGAFIAYNDDDDDDNHVADRDENGPITPSGAPGSYYEDNLIKITLQKVFPTALTGNVTLEANAAQKVWTTPTKGTEVPLPKTYATPTDLPKELYVEGFTASTSVRDMMLTLKFTVEGKTFKDVVNLTVIDVASIAVDGTDQKTHKIDSVLSASDVPDDHFVTAEGSGDIKLEATIAPNTDETRDTISWTAMTQDPGDKLKATKSRAASAKYPGTVNVLGKTARNFTNWVVWSTASSSANPIYKELQEARKIVSGGYDVIHTISPADIITQSDRPDLSGPKSSNPPNVPSGDTGVANKGVSLAGGADKKWDSSRQIRRRVVNPDSIVFDPALHDITKYTTYLNYPSDDVCGNDDKTADDEYNDPYTVPYAGAVCGEDAPQRTPYHSEGNLNNTFEIRNHMRAFARLNIGGKWYRISDWYLWKVHFKFKKQNESEATWGLDFNGDGDQLDTVPVWRDNGSFIALDNSGF